MPVAALFHQARDRVVASVDRVFAEPVRLLPLKDGEPDPDRTVIEFEAVLRVGGGDEQKLAGRGSSAWRSKLAAGKSELHIDQAANPSVVARMNDMVIALSRKGEPMFEVLRIDDRGEARLVLELGEA